MDGFRTLDDKKKLILVNQLMFQKYIDSDGFTREGFRDFLFSGFTFHIVGC
jgi:hypothetical protein